MRALIAMLAVLFANCGGPATPAKTEDATTEPLMEKLMAYWATIDSSKVAQYYAKDRKDSMMPDAR